MSGRRVSYFYDPDVGNIYYGQGHPMKPHRIRLAHSLVLNYGLYKYLRIYRPRLASFEDMTQFHSDDYVDFISSITVDDLEDFGFRDTLKIFNVGDDCPVFDGLYQLAQVSAGGSIAGAVKLNHGSADIAVNWAGGLHHAKKSEASGFCYVNDIVLSILELLKYHERVLYIDIDIHHGDGVEEAFYTSDRVMTVSFHKYGEYFPGTGNVNDIGCIDGKYYSVNFPLREGMDDVSFEYIFKPVIDDVVERYRPGAIVLQCGADSLSGDRLGCFNLSLKGHGACVTHVKGYQLPLLVLGGGGYTIRNVARCWAYETGLVLDRELSDGIPYNDYYDYYGPHHKLHITPSNMENLNDRDHLERLTKHIMQNLRYLEGAPSVQLREPPPDLVKEAELDADEPDPDERDNVLSAEQRVAHVAEIDESDDEGETGGVPRRRNRTVVT